MICRFGVVVAGISNGADSILFLIVLQRLLCMCSMLSSPELGAEGWVMRFIPPGRIIPLSGHFLRRVLYQFESNSGSQCSQLAISESRSNLHLNNQ